MTTINGKRSHAAKPGSASSSILSQRRKVAEIGASSSSNVRRSGRDTHASQTQRASTMLYSDPTPISQQRWASCPERNSDLSLLESSQNGQCEGFRVGEIVSFKLTRPITHQEGDAHGEIREWPAVIGRRTFVVQIKSQDSNMPKDEFTLEGRVKQRRQYEVQLLGTMEVVCVGEERLSCALRYVRTRLRNCYIDESALKADNSMPLNLENGKQRAPWRQIMLAFIVQQYTCEMLRTHYTLLESFTRADKKKMLPLVRGEETEEDDAPVVQKAAPLPAAKLVGQTVNPYMELDNDESDDRRRHTIQALRSTTSKVVDTNTYWQGLFFGLELIWVSDLVRLGLSEEDVRSMMEGLARQNALEQPRDLHRIDVRSSYVLRLKAVYRPTGATTNAQTQIAGDVFRVVERDLVPRDSRLDKVTGNQRDTSSSSARSIKSDRSSPGAKHRAEFLIPPRPFLPPDHDATMPLTPQLPPQFAFQRVNRTSIDVCFSLRQMAGRLYTSAASKAYKAGEDLPTIVRKEKMKEWESDRDTRNVRRCQLSLAGLLSGAIRDMGIDGACHATREDAIATCRNEAVKIIVSKLAEDRQERRKKVGDTSRTSSRGPHTSSSLTGSKQNGKGRARDDNGGGGSSSSAAVALSHGLPPHWIAVETRDEEGVFYANTVTKVSQWNRPT